MSDVRARYFERFSPEFLRPQASRSDVVDICSKRCRAIGVARVTKSSPRWKLLYASMGGRSASG